MAASGTSASTSPSPSRSPSASTVHPRLFVTSIDVERIRSRIAAGDRLWDEGMAVAVDRVRRLVDAGTGADDGSPGWVEDPVEADAELLAFASLVEPDPSVRAADAVRARRLLMHGIDAALAGPSAGEPYRDPSFAIDDRSRWWGEAWPLTVDWIHSTLSTADLRSIRTVFARWTAEAVAGGQTTHDHPEPAGLHDDPALLADSSALPWAENNYFTAHGRNVALMALALDPADDPDGQVRGRLLDATGSFLFMTDAVLRGIGRGGAPAEGFEYGPQSLGYVAETLLALHTAGADDPATGGAQVTFAGNSFWDEVGPWLLSNLSPAPVARADGSSGFVPALFGDAQHGRNPDWIQVFAPLGLVDESTGDHAARLATSRWIETDTPDGGATGVVDRIADADAPLAGILTFLLLDPAGPQTADPRPRLPTVSVAAGVGRVSARTGWGPDDTWLTFGVGWNRIDHQNGDGLGIGLFSHGEWLTTGRSGYDVMTSDEFDTLAIQNRAPEHADATDYRGLEWSRGSQFTYVPSAPGILSGVASGAGWFATGGDATGLYDSESEGATAVTRATRDVVWLQPGTVVVRDRATTDQAGLFKRFVLQLPGMPTIHGHRASVVTPGGQRLDVTTVLPEQSTISATPVAVDDNGDVDGEGQLAIGDPMTHRLQVDATGAPADVHFLHVLQVGEHADRTAPVPTLLRSGDGTTAEGVVVGSTAVLFVDPALGVPFGVDVPAEVTRVLVDGVAPGTPVRWVQGSNRLDVGARPAVPQPRDAGTIPVLEVDR